MVPMPLAQVAANPMMHQGQVQIGQTMPHLAQPQSTTAPPGASDYVSGMRNRLAWLEGQVLLASSYKKEIKILKRMLAPLKRRPRAKVTRLKVAK